VEERFGARVRPQDSRDHLGARRRAATLHVKPPARGRQLSDSQPRRFSVGGRRTAAVARLVEERFGARVRPQDSRDHLGARRRAATLHAKPPARGRQLSDSQPRRLSVGGRKTAAVARLVGRTIRCARPTARQSRSLRCSASGCNVSRVASGSRHTVQQLASRGAWA
jgi:hypothetical protein